MKVIEVKNYARGTYFDCTTTYITSACFSNNTEKTVLDFSSPSRKAKVSRFFFLPLTMKSSKPYAVPQTNAISNGKHCKIKVKRGFFPRISCIAPGSSHNSRERKIVLLLPQLHELFFFLFFYRRNKKSTFFEGKLLETDSRLSVNIG